MAFAERTFALEKVEDGATLRQTLEGLIERTRNPKRLEELRAELDCPPCPMPLLYLWNIFMRLRNRAINSMGPAAIGWGELAAFVALTGERLSPWEIETIEMLDLLYLGQRDG